MVNENFWLGRSRVRERSPTARRTSRSATPEPIGSGPATTSSRTSPDKRARREHPRGHILDIRGGVAVVRWQGELNAVQVALHLLVKDKD